MKELSNSSDIAGLLRPGMRVYIGGGACEPETFVDALREHPESCAGVTFIQSIVPGLTRNDFASFHPDARSTTIFMSGETQSSYANGDIDFIPMQLWVMADYLREHPVDLAAVHLAPTGDASVFNPGPNSDFIDAVTENATTVLAEINAKAPAILNAPAVPASRLDYIVHVFRDHADFPFVEPNEDALTIAGYVAELVNDGDCIQWGIGAIPYAVMTALRDKNDLGIHSGVFDDAGMALVQSGVVTGNYKTIDKGLAVGASFFGTQPFYQWLAEAKDIAARPYSYTHDGTVLASIDNLVSINSAVEVDLTGQVNAEMVRGRQLSGTGGSVDFMRGASASRGGRSILAMNA
ncbi:MAG: 4-hydroxybutyrate CoA-transferase, partial [Chromatiales bacterium]|nr:4-hydroxybutyrate CoA-transferase [Chromatiales bacterium]